MEKLYVLSSHGIHPSEKIYVTIIRILSVWSFHLNRYGFFFYGVKSIRVIAVRISSEKVSFKKIENKAATNMAQTVLAFS